MKTSPYVIESLGMSRGELRARFINEFSEDEKRQLAAYLRELADEEGFAMGSHLDDWERDVPEIARYWQKGSPAKATPWASRWRAGRGARNVE